jgi:hypothetical protein
MDIGNRPGRGEERPAVIFIMQVIFALFTLLATVFFLRPVLFPDYDLPPFGSLRERIGHATVVNDPMHGPWKEGGRFWLRLDGEQLPFVIKEKCGGTTTMMVRAVLDAREPVTLSFDPRPERENSTLIAYYSVFAIRVGHEPLMTYGQCRSSWMQANRFTIYPAIVFLGAIYLAWFRVFSLRKSKR